MKKILLIFLSFLIASPAFAYKATYNPHTGRLDYVGVGASADVNLVCGSGQTLVSSGGGTWACGAGSTGTAAGSNTQVQYNDGGGFGADSGLTWNKTTKILSLTGPDAAGISFGNITTDASDYLFLNADQATLNASGNGLVYQAGAGNGSGAGGGYYFTAGDGGATGTGGALRRIAGNGGGTSGTGGNILDTAGNATSGTGGSLFYTAGNTSSGTGGTVFVTSGNSSSGNAGDISLTTGDAGGTNKNAGGLNLVFGAKTGSGATGKWVVFPSGSANSYTFNFDSLASSSKTLTFPNQTGTFCTTGSVCSGYAAAATGSNTQVIFNDGGSALGGDAGLVYDKTNDKLSILGSADNVRLYLRSAAFPGFDLMEWADFTDTRQGYIDNSGSVNVGTHGTILGVDATVIRPSSLGIVPLTVKGIASQSADLQEWQNSSGTILASVDSAGVFALGTEAANTGKIKFKNSTNSKRLTLQPGVTSSDLTFVLPNNDGTNGQVLQTNGAGVLSFVTASGGSGSPGGASGNLQFNDGAGGFAGLTGSTAQSAASPHLTIQAQSATYVPLLLKGATSQSADFLDIQNSSGTNVALIDSTGAATFGVSGGSSSFKITILGGYGGQVGNIAGGGFGIVAGATGTGGGFALGASGDAHIYPVYNGSFDNSINLGASVNRFANFYSVLGTFSGVLSVASGSSTVFAKVGGVIFDHYNDSSSIHTDSTEDDLYSDTLPASTLGTNGDKIVAMYSGTTVGHVSATRQIRAYFGGTLIYDSTAQITNPALNWDMKVTVIRESSSVVRCSVAFNDNLNLTTYPDAQYTRITGLTLSNTQILKVTGTSVGFGSASGDVTAVFASGSWNPAA